MSYGVRVYALLSLFVVSYLSVLFLLSRPGAPRWLYALVGSLLTALVAGVAAVMVLV